MELHQLRYFVAVVECGSFRRAATRCRIAQPSLSQQIMKLERDLGHRLFDRLGRRIAITESGQALLPRARQILAEVREAERCISTDLARGRGRLVVGAIPTVAPYLLPRAVRRFRKQMPEAELSIDEDFTDVLVQSLRDAELDVAILSLPLEHNFLETDVLATEALLVVADAAHPLAAATRVSVDDLRPHSTVVLHEMHCLGEQVRAFCQGYGAQPTIRCRSTQLSTLQELVAMGMGISLVPQMCARADRSKRRVYRRFHDPEPRRSIVAAWHGNRARSVLAQRFVEAVRAECQRQATAPDPAAV